MDIEKQKQEKEKAKASAEKEGKNPDAKTSKETVAVIRIRGLIGARKDIKDAMKMLRLLRNNCCVVLEKTPSNVGMIRKVKDYVAWGEINDAVLKALIDKRSEKNPRDPKRTKPFFRLNPPKKGFERKGIKKPYSSGGALGYRGEKINALIMKMI